MTILLTAISTFIVTVVAGLLGDYLRNARPRIVYSTGKSLPIDLDKKKIGAYLVTLTNTSKKTVKDVSVMVDASPASLRNGGISATTGLKYEITTRDGKLELAIPFLNEKDELSLTAIAEALAYVPTRPDVTIRAPQPFKLDNRDNVRQTSPLLPILLGGLLTAVAVGFTLWLYGSTIYLSQSSPLVDQKDVLVYSAVVNGLPEMAKEIAGTSNPYYFNQGDMAYLYASQSNDPQQQTKYKQFLVTVVDYAGDNMHPTSKANLYFNTAKISLLLSENDEANRYFAKAIQLDKPFIQKQIKYDSFISSYIDHQKLLSP